jgi:hypothetical protein
MVIGPTGIVYGRTFTPVTATARDIVPMTNALPAVLGLHGVRFFNEETHRQDMRLEVADVEVVFPELVSEAAAEGPLSKGVNYMGLAAPIIEAIRELNDRLTALENRLTALENSP